MRVENTLPDRLFFGRQMASSYQSDDLLRDWDRKMRPYATRLGLAGSILPPNS